MTPYDVSHLRINCPLFGKCQKGVSACACYVTYVRVFKIGMQEYLVPDFDW